MNKWIKFFIDQIKIIELQIVTLIIPSNIKLNYINHIKLEHWPIIIEHVKFVSESCGGFTGHDIKRYQAEVHSIF